jgi:hypothetical protein
MEVGVFRKAWLTAALVFVVGCSKYTGVDASAPDASVKALTMADASIAAPRATSLFGDAGIKRLGAAFGAVGGDLAGYMPEPTIAKIDGINLPAPSGTSTVLTYGGGALSWSLPPAAGDGGAGVVWSNDLVGSTNSAQWVASIGGQGGAGGNVPVPATSFTWGSTGTIIHDTTVKGNFFEKDSSNNALWELSEYPSTPSQAAIYALGVSPSTTNWVINANSSATGVNGPTGTYLNVAGSPAFQAGSGFVKVFDASASTMWQLQYVPSTSIPAMYPVGVTPGSTNYTVASNTSGTLLNAPGSSANLDLLTNGVTVESMSSAGLITTWDTAGNKLLQFTEVPSTTNGAIYSGQVSAGSSNYALAATNNETALNSPGVTAIAVAGTPLVEYGQGGSGFTSVGVTLNGTTQDLTIATGSGVDIYPTLVLSGSLSGTNVLVMENVPGEWTLDIVGIANTSGNLSIKSGSGSFAILHSLAIYGTPGSVGLLRIRTTGANSVSSSYIN